MMTEAIDVINDGIVPVTVRTPDGMGAFTETTVYLDAFLVDATIGYEAQVWQDTADTNGAKWLVKLQEIFANFGLAGLTAKTALELSKKIDSRTSAVEKKSEAMREQEAAPASPTPIT